jgi:hypothetical protein
VTCPDEDGSSSPKTSSAELTRPLVETLIAETADHASDILAVQAKLQALLRANRTSIDRQPQDTRRAARWQPDDRKQTGGGTELRWAVPVS